MIIRPEKFTKEEWLELSQYAFIATFGEKRPVELERFSFALVAFDDAQIPGGWVTCIEMDSETIYWQHGGVLPNYELTPYMFRGYQVLVDWCKEHYKRITTRIENTNITMIKLAFKVGFLVTGVHMFNGKVYLELTNEFN